MPEPRPSQGYCVLPREFPEGFDIVGGHARLYKNKMEAIRAAFWGEINLSDVAIFLVETHGEVGLKEEFRIVDCELAPEATRAATWLRQEKVIV